MKNPKCPSFYRHYAPT